VNLINCHQNVIKLINIETLLRLNLFGLGLFLDLILTEALIQFCYSSIV